MAEKKYIEIEAAIEAIKSLYPSVPFVKLNIDKWHEKNKAYMECEIAIESLPTADVRPVVHGKWICGDYWSEGCGMGESYGFYYKCSVCKDVVQGGYKDCGMKYCPNCGADMRPQPPKEETT